MSVISPRRSNPVFSRTAALTPTRLSACKHDSPKRIAITDIVTDYIHRGCDFIQLNPDSLHNFLNHYKSCIATTKHQTISMGMRSRVGSVVFLEYASIQLSLAESRFAGRYEERDASRSSIEKSCITTEKQNLRRGNAWSG
jgi:hypothetical protein